ncbi:Met-10+ like-protein-domain-containing protein [Xylariaceae sp. FL0662B]|nr:Met-10+ like-protein-domain-containing protein [Xylariaceae sp. FL0662B]
MSFNSKDTRAYRDDERAGHKILDTQQREELVKEASHFGIRKFLRSQLYVFLYVLVHAIFSVYIHVRVAYHIVSAQILSILKYHHNTPDFVRRDVSTLPRLPTHLSVILTLEDGGRPGDALEKLVHEASEVAAWCASAGIPRLSVYERTGVLKRYMPQMHRALTHKLKAWFGRYQAPPLSLSTRGAATVHSLSREYGSHDQEILQVNLICEDDGREAMVDLTKVLTQMVQKEKISAKDVTLDVIDNELSEAVMVEPDLLISFEPYVDLQGYPPWPIRLTEIYCAPDNQGVGYQIFLQGLRNLFCPPIITRSAATGVPALDRSLFFKTVNLAAAAIADRRKIAEWRQKLIRDRLLLRVDRISPVVSHPDQALAAQGTRCLLLDPAVKAGVCSYANSPCATPGMAWLTSVLVDIMKSLLSPDVRDEHHGFPAGFNQVGHVAHLNLREAFWPYKKLIAEVLLDKNPIIKTVINKVANVGTESEFRTFEYEVLAGPDDLNVEVRENDCVFQFDYSKVYWNSKLESEHTRLINTFQPGQVVCDVMAGVGPFAVPAGKKGVFVWANDYNPAGYSYLTASIKRNKVEQYVRSFNQDGRTFIREAADLVYAASSNGERALAGINSRKEKRRQHPNASGNVPKPEIIPIPPTISHFVMNLPASAITFLPHFRGLYAGHEQLFVPHTSTELPIIHVHCFAAKTDDDGPLLDVCERISAEMGVEMKLGSAEDAGEISVVEVRDVAPNKRMFCASFRLSPEVAFAPRT